MLGTLTSPVEIQGIAKHGFWLLLDETEELFVPFTAFPWFQRASVEQIFQVQHPRPQHLYWEALDIDLDIESIRCPYKFPLVAT